MSDIVISTVPADDPALLGIKHGDGWIWALYISRSGAWWANLQCG